MASDGTEVRVAMTPEERANKVRASYEDAARRHPHNGNIDALLPPGSIILTPDEAAKVRRVAHEFTAWAEDWNDGTYAYYKSEGLMVACVALRSMLGGGS